MQWLKKSLTEIAQLAAGLTATISGFLLPPPSGFLAMDTNVWPKLGAFVISVLTALLIVVGHRTKTRGHTTKWFIASASLLAMALVGFFSYRYLTSLRTCSYYEETRIIGTQLTPEGAAYVSDNPASGCEDILKAFTGHAKEAWVETSILRSELLLTITYISVLPLLAIACIASLQTLRCSRARK